MKKIESIFLSFFISKENFYLKKCKNMLKYYKIAIKENFMIKKSKVFISLFLTIIIFFIAVFINYNNKYNIVQAFSMKNKKDIDIVAVGNILVHYDQIVAAYNSENDEYEFDENFKYIKKYIEEAFCM